MCAIASSFLASHGRLQAECNTLFIPAAFCVDGARLFRKALRSDNHLIGRALWYTHREFPSRAGVALPAEFLVTGPSNRKLYVLGGTSFVVELRSVSHVIIC